MNNAVKFALRGWWAEHNRANTADILSFSSRDMRVAHFTAMVQDRTGRVGCGCKVYGKDQILFVCNYSFTNIVGLSVYKKGQTASACRTGTNPNYWNLCSLNEIVLVPPIP